MSYETEIENYIGTDVVNLTSAQVVQFLKDGQQELINLLPLEALSGLETEVNFGGIVDSVAIGGSSNGSYADGDTIAFSAPQVETGVTATGTIAIDGSGNISAVTITDKGSGYTSAPTITITSSSGSGQTLTATLANNYATIPTQAVMSVLRETETKLGNSNVNNDTTDSDGNVTAIVYDETLTMECREVRKALKGRLATGSGWLEEATETDPVWYRDRGRAYILPTPKMNAYVSYAAPINIKTTNLDLGQMPNEIEYLVILFASVKSCILALKALRSEIPELTSLDSDFVSQSLGTTLNDLSGDLNDVFNHADTPVIDDGFDAGEFKAQFDAASNSLVQYIVDEDIDLASVQVQVLNTMLSKFQAELGKTNAMVDNVVKGFSAKVQLVQTMMAELKAKLEKYQIKKAGITEIQAQLDAMYKQGIQALIRRYRTVQEDLGGGQVQNNVMPQQQ
tara:strand:+ start:332 stop:1690 length:1359 start_codon:yes stop_codon:yes gene_type:complete